MIIKANFIACIILLSTNVNKGFSQLNTQNIVEVAIHETTFEYRNQISDADNAIKKMRLYKEWHEKIKEITNMGEELTFKGLVWSVSFNEESSLYVLRIGSHNETVPVPTFYNYQFGSSDVLIDDLAQLERRDEVIFRFKFIDTFYPDTANSERYMEFRGFPTEKNPDTGNYAYMLYIELHDIELISD